MPSDENKVLVQHPSKNDFTLKRISWSRRIWLLLRGKQSQKWTKWDTSN
jgi:hypothetical protein